MQQYVCNHVNIDMFWHVQEHNKSELERFDEERQRDFMNMLHGFVQTQVRVCSRPFLLLSS